MPKSTLRCVDLELLEQFPARRALALHEQVHLVLGEERLHLVGQLLHAAIAGEKNKGAPFRFRDKMRDPLRQRFVVTGVARIRHLLHDEQLHLRR